MNIKVFGFKIDKNALPPAIDPSMVFKFVELNAGNPVGKAGLLRISVTEVDWNFDGKPEKWWAGMILKSRDAQTMPRLGKDADGTLTLTSEDIGETAEIGFFIGHPTTGNGLIACYHSGPSFIIFRALMKKLFLNNRKLLKDAEFPEHGTNAERLAVTQRYKGGLSISHLPREGSLKEFLKSFRHLSMMELGDSFTSDKTGLFSKWKDKAKSQTLRLKLPPDLVLTDEMLQELESAIADDQKRADLRITGIHRLFGRQTVSGDMLSNKMIFGEDGYDKLLGKIKWKLNDWGPAIKSSEVIKWLLRLTSDPTTRSRLTS